MTETPRSYVALFRLFRLAVMLVTGGNVWRAFGAEVLEPGSGDLKYEEPKYLSGAIYAGERRQLLFNFKRVVRRSGSTLNVRRDFAYPDGKLAAREHVVYEGDALVFYELQELQTGALGSATIRRAKDNPDKGSIEFGYIREAGGRGKLRTEVLQDQTLVADMTGLFLASHWDALWRGEKVKCRFIVVPRCQTVGFDFIKDSATTRGGRDVLIVRMEASSLFVGALVEPLFFTMEQAPPHRVLEYFGRTTPKIPERGKWKDLDALTVFDWKSAR